MYVYIYINGTRLSRRGLPRHAATKGEPFGSALSLLLALFIYQYIYTPTWPSPLMPRAALTRSHHRWTI